MVTSVPVKQGHCFTIEKEIGTCLCGEKRKYIQANNPKENHFEVLQVGDPNYDHSKYRPFTLHQDGISGPPGHIPAPPVLSHPIPIMTDVHSKHNFYTEHTKEIIEDCQKLGKRATRLKWKIVTSTLNRLLDDNGIKRPHRPLLRKPVEAPAAIRTDPKIPDTAEYTEGYLKGYQEALKANPVDKANNPLTDTLNSIIDYWRNQSEATNLCEERLVIDLTADLLESYRKSIEGK
jgi:hypothetical protein